jgi:hypothetical protein
VGCINIFIPLQLFASLHCCCSLCDIIAITATLAAKRQQRRWQSGYSASAGWLPPPLGLINGLCSGRCLLLIGKLQTNGLFYARSAQQLVHFAPTEDIHPCFFDGFFYFYMSHINIHCGIFALISNHAHFELLAVLFSNYGICILTQYTMRHPTLKMIFENMLSLLSLLGKLNEISSILQNFRMIYNLCK